MVPASPGHWQVFAERRTPSKHRCWFATRPELQIDPCFPVALYRPRPVYSLLPQYPVEVTKMKCPDSIRRPFARAFLLLSAAIHLPAASLAVENAGHARWLNRTISFQFEALDGQTVQAEQFRGKVVLLDFWATWCGPCLREIPHVVAVRRKFRQQGLEIVGFSFDTDRNALARLVRERDMDWPQHFDPRGQPTLGLQLQIEAIPSMWLLDRAGRVRFTDARFNLEEKIQQLLDEPYDDGLPHPQGFYTELSGSPGPKKKTVPLATWHRVDPGELKPAGDTADGLKLKGLINSTRLQQAMLSIDGVSVTLEPGQSQKVTLNGHPETIKCEAISGQTVRLSVAGRSQELSLPE